MFKGLRTRQTNDLSLFMGKKDEMPVCVSKAATKQNKTKKKKERKKKGKGRVPISSFSSIQSMDWMKPTHIGQDSLL